MIIFQKFISRTDLWDNPDVIYVFGDNDMREGKGGQAKEMRGEPNSIGIRVKKAPKISSEAYYKDEEYAENAPKIAEDLIKVEKALIENKIVIIPSSGIGTGLARLKEFAPQTLTFICDSIRHLRRKYNEK